jgi:hypothetical protein
MSPLRTFHVVLCDGKILVVYAHAHDAAQNPCGNLSFVKYTSADSAQVSCVLAGGVWRALIDVTPEEVKTDLEISRLLASFSGSMRIH